MINTNNSVVQFKSDLDLHNIALENNKETINSLLTDMDNMLIEQKYCYYVINATMNYFNSVTDLKNINIFNLRSIFKECIDQLKLISEPSVELSSLIKKIIRLYDDTNNVYYVYKADRDYRYISNYELRTTPIINDLRNETISYYNDIEDTYNKFERVKLLMT